VPSVLIQLGSYSLYIYIRVERPTRSKPEPVIINSSSNTSATATTSTKSNRVPHGPSLPSSKTQVTSTTQNKNESNEPPTSGRTIKLSSNGNDRLESPPTSIVSTTRESPPTSKKDSSTIVER